MGWRVPRQYSTWGKQRLFGSSKRGDIYLRGMLIHGAPRVLLRVKYNTGGFGQWVYLLAQRAPRNKVVVAIANELARMAWAVLSCSTDLMTTVRPDFPSFCKWDWRGMHLLFRGPRAWLIWMNLHRVSLPLKNTKIRSKLHNRPLQELHLHLLLTFISSLSASRL
jgi:hypothetical protein